MIYASKTNIAVFPKSTIISVNLTWLEKQNLSKENKTSFTK